VSGPDAPLAEARRQALVQGPWTTVHQVHGSAVAVVEVPGSLEVEADALVTDVPGLAIACLAADCALIGFSSPEGVIGVAHAGWRGLLDGVIEHTVDELRRHGATAVRAVTSAMIHSECYEFSPGDLDAAASSFGEVVRARTADGRPAFDLPAGISEALRRAAAEEVGSLGGCTGCDPGWFSARTRADAGRHALVLWREEPAS
jgi:copper oxidase (laccase) domain-containing protein